MPTGESEPIAVAIVHAHAIGRAGLRTLLQEAGVRVALEVAHCDELVEQLKDPTGVQAVLLHLELPVQRTVNALAHLLAAHGSMGIVVVGELTDAVVHHIVRAHARGVLAQAVEPAELHQAVRAVAAGGMHTNAWLSRQWEQKRGKAAAIKRAAVELTTREYEVLRLICHKAGYTYKVIGEKLGIHKRTAETYRDALFAKFSVGTKMALMHTAAELRYI